MTRLTLPNYLSLNPRNKTLNYTGKNPLSPIILIFINIRINTHLEMRVSQYHPRPDIHHEFLNFRHQSYPL
jgi:hypothetical protein